MPKRTKNSIEEIADIVMDQLTNDLTKYAWNFARGYSRYVMTEYTSYAQSAIQAFYNAYDPEFYDRTYDLLNNSYIPYYKESAKAVYGGVSIGPDKMSDYVSGGKLKNDNGDISYGGEKVVSASVVFDWTWNQGLHGHRSDGTPITSTPPMDIVQDFVNSFFNNGGHDKAVSAGMKQANSGKYKLLNKFM